MKKTRKKRTRTGSSFAFWRGRLLRAASLLLLCASGIYAKDKNAPTPYAVVAGTVFRDSGFALPGAEVELTAASSQSQETRKVKKLKAVSDARGEFAFRVPPAAADYKVAVRAPGYQPQEKPVSIAGEVRMDVFFRLEPASNSERKH